MSEVERISIIDEVLKELGQKFPFVRSPQYFEDLDMGDLQIVTSQGNRKEIDDSSVIPNQIQIKTDSEKEGVYDFQENSSFSSSEFLSLDFKFSHYIDLLKKIQFFQANKDTIGYSNWVNQPKNTSARIFLGLKKYAKDMQTKNPKILDEIYSRIASQEKLSSKQIQDVQSKIKRYDLLQKYISEFSQSLQKEETELVTVVKVLWPDVIKNLDSEWNLELLLSRLDLAMVNIASFVLQAKSRSLLQNIFVKAESIYTTNS